MRLLLPVLFFTALGAADAFRILGVFPFPGKSHLAMYLTVMKELARRGHQVDVVSSYPLKQPIANYTEIVVNNVGNLPEITFDIMERSSPVIDVKAVSTLGGNEICKQLKKQPLQSLIRDAPRDTYDIVITELFGANCYLAFGHLFDAPMVSMLSSVLLPWANDPVANIDNPSYIPNCFLPFTEHMTFWERLVNTVVTLGTKMLFHFLTSEQNAIVREAFGPGLPELRELEKSIDLLLVNSHYSLSGVRPFVPAVVEVGGLHIQDSNAEVSAELEKWLDESTSGVVYFSMGASFTTESLPPAALASFYASFAKLAPIRVLWKAKKEELPEGLPKNVLTMNWFPQNLVLRHRNVKVFLTHGGLMGTQEAIYVGVPLIGIPMFADQSLNIRNYVNKKLAVSIDKHDITEKSLDAAFKAVLEDPTYRENAQRVGKLFRDRPMTALDTAVWWIEYIGRHGKGSLRSPALELTWWQVALIDVYAVLLSATILSLYLVQLIVRALLAWLRKFLNQRAKKIQ